MASYGVVRTMKALPVGSVQPWVGELTKIPKGWLLCNGAELNASDYPLLARIIKDTYGGTGFSGDFPNFLGTFRLPPINQKGLADISTDYFNANSALRPGPMDTADAAAVVSQYIGDIGDLGPPTTVYARTDLNFEYIPDPEGTIRSFSSAGTAATSTSTVVYRNVGVSGGTGTGAIFNVVRNTDNTYTTVIVNRGEDYKVGDILTIQGSQLGGSSPTNNLTITVNAIGNAFFSGTISGQTFLPGFGTASVFVVPRKLGRQHFPQHFHPGQYETINKGDSGEQPGNGVGVFDNPTINMFEWYSRINPCPCDYILPCPVADDANDTAEASGQTWGNQTGPGLGNTVSNITQPFSSGVGRFAIGAIVGTRPARTHTPKTTGANYHGIGKDWFTQAKNLRDRDNNSTASSPANAALQNIKTDGKLRLNYVVPFSDDRTGVKSPNYDDGVDGSDLQVGRTETLFNHAAVSFTKTTRTGGGINDVIDTHDHEGEFLVTYDRGSLNISPQITVNVQPNVTPDNVPGAFQIVFTIPSPSLAIVHLIRAY